MLLWHMQFCFADFGLFLLPAYVSLGASNFVSKSFLKYLLFTLYLCLDCQAHSIFYTMHFVYFLCLIVWYLNIHVFVCILQCLKQKAVWKEYICICILSAKVRTSYWQYLVTIPHVLYMWGIASHAVGESLHFCVMGSTPSHMYC